MNQRQLIFSFVLTIILGCTLQAQSTPQQSLLALSKKDQTLAILDPSSLRVLARIPVGNDPHEVIASSDGKTAYVSNY
jgi:DNA-binding beta-propeller fold protein YncE